MPTVPETFALAWKHHQAGTIPQAEQLYRQIVQAEPGHAEAWYLLGTILQSQGRLPEAATHYQQALRHKPQLAEAHFQLGNLARSLGKLADSEAYYREALRHRPDIAEIHHQLGEVLTGLGKLDDAVSAYQQAVRLKPNFTEAYNSLGITLKTRGRLDEAVSALQQAIRLQPNFFAAHNNLGNVFLEQNRLHEAVESYRVALQYGPNVVEVNNNLGTALAGQGRLDEAAVCFEQTLRLKPDYIEAYNNLGDALKEQGKLDEAVACFRRALAVRPDFGVGHSNLLLCLNYHPRFDAAALLAEHRQWGIMHGQVKGPIAPHANNRDPERRLRIGYVSPDFRRHPVARFLEPILTHHDPRQVEAIGYAEVPLADDMTARLKSALHGWRSTCGLSGQQIVELVRRDEVDILVDLNGHMRNPRLGVFAHKAAPIQVSYLGYPNTTGLTTIDYRVTDAIADPPGEPVCHTEELVRLPGSFCCYAPPDDAPEPAPLPAQKTGYITFGSLHNLAKFNTGVFDLWSRVMRALPSSRLVVYRHTLKGKTADEMKRQFAERGVDGSRIDLRSTLPPGRGYLDIFEEMDIFLDALPWSAHTTACEGFWMGVPLLTLRGTRHAGRMASSVLTCIGLTDWIAETPDEFVSLAVRHAGDVEGMAQLRSQLRQRMRSSPLCDGKSFARKLEEAYRGMWRRWCGAQSG